MIKSTIPKKRTVDHRVMMYHGSTPGPGQPLPAQSRGPQTTGHGAARISKSNQSEWVSREMTARPRPPIPAPNSGPRAIGPGTVSLSESEEDPVSEPGPGNDCKATSAVSRAQQRAADYWSGAVRTPGV